MLQRDPASGLCGVSVWVVWCLMRQLCFCPTAAVVASRRLAFGLALCVAANGGQAAPGRAGHAPAPSSLNLASLVIGEAEDLKAGLDEVDPRPDLKGDITQFPSPDTTHRGDPALGLRPTFESRLRGERGL